MIFRHNLTTNLMIFCKLGLWYDITVILPSVSAQWVNRSTLSKM